MALKSSRTRRRDKHQPEVYDTYGAPHAPEAAPGSSPMGAGAYRPAYTPGSQGQAANAAFSRQAGGSQYSRTNPAYSTRSSRKSKRGKKIALGVLAAVLLVAIGGGTALAMWVNSVNDTLTKGDKSSEELTAIQDALTPTSRDFTEPFYMMLIGSDRRVGDDAAGARSDTNIVVRVDPVNNQATMVSIPRDTQIDIDGYGINKFNAAYNYGGAAACIKEASQLTGVNISHYAEVNFDELISLVDAVGGVDVMVDERIDDTDADNTTDNPGAPRIIIEAGEQHLNGEQALVFARSRAYVDGDFTRTANQRKLIMAIVNKVLNMSVTEMPGVIQAAAKSVTTDLSVNDIISLAQQFRDAGDLTLYSAMVPSTTGMEDGVSYVYTDEESLKKMMQVVEEGGDPSGITASPEAYAAAEAKSNGSGSGSGYDSGSGGGYYDPSYDSSGYGGYYDSGYYGSSTYSDNSSTYYDDSSTYYDPGYSSSGYDSGASTGGGYDAGTGSSGGYDSGYSAGGATDTGAGAGGYDSGAAAGGAASGTGTGAL